MSGKFFVCCFLFVVTFSFGQSDYISYSIDYKARVIETDTLLVKLDIDVLDSLNVLSYSVLADGKKYENDNNGKFELKFITDKLINSYCKYYCKGIFTDWKANIVVIYKGGVDTLALSGNYYIRAGTPLLIQQNNVKSSSFVMYKNCGEYLRFYTGTGKQRGYTLVFSDTTESFKVDTSRAGNLVIYPNQDGYITANINGQSLDTFFYETKDVKDLVEVDITNGRRTLNLRGINGFYEVNYKDFRVLSLKFKFKDFFRYQHPKDSRLKFKECDVNIFRKGELLYSWKSESVKNLFLGEKQSYTLLPNDVIIVDHIVLKRSADIGGIEYLKLEDELGFILK